MPDEPTAHTEATRLADYKQALETELEGAKARAAFDGLEESVKARLEGYVKDVEEELARITGGGSKPVAKAATPA